MNRSVNTLQLGVNLIAEQFNYLYPVSDELKEALLNNTFLIKLKADEVLLKEDEHCNYVYFIINGALSGYCLKRKKYITTFISISNEFVTSISGMYGAVPSKEGIKALVDTNAVALSSKVWQEWYVSIPETNILMRKILEKYYQDAQERSIIVRIGTAREKFLYYLNAYPKHIGKVPLNAIASFLDLNPNNLAKIKRQYDLNVAEVDLKNQSLLIDQYIQQHELYKQKGLTITQLALELSLTVHQLSFIINHYFQMNFTGLINKHRIKFIKAKLQESENLQKFSVDSLGQEAGFSSGSNFFATFKKSVGLSPVEYAMKLLNEKIRPDL